MDSLAKQLAHIRSTIKDIASLPDAEVAEVVEAGTILAAIVTSATNALTDIKSNLRDTALSELEGSGSVDIEGSEVGKVTVTVPKPKLSLVKGTDPEVLKRHLGDNFDLYFETKVSYAPRKNAGEMVARMATGQDRDLLLCSLEESAQTPRVSFRKI